MLGRITTTTHGFTIEVFSPQLYPPLRAFCRLLTPTTSKRDVRTGEIHKVVGKTYAFRWNKGNKFSFCKNSKNDFIDTFKRFGFSEKQITGFDKLTALLPLQEYPWDGEYADIAVNSDITPRENQLPLLKFLELTFPINVVPLPTGQGKTLSTLLYLSRIKVRAVLICTESHINTWMETLVEKTNVDPNSIFRIKGNDKIVDVTILGLDAIDSSPFIIIGVKALHAYLDSFAYQKDAAVTAPYELLPDMFFETLRVGCVIIDECHENASLLFKMFSVMNMPKTIALSATLDPSDSMKSKILNYMYPEEYRFKEFKENKHMRAGCVHYFLGQSSIAKSIKYMGPMGYSHVKFEQSIMKYKGITFQYFNLIFDILKMDYFKRRRPGTKALILFQTTDMVEKFATFMSEQKEFEVNGVGSFYAAKPVSILDNNEIICSTTKSCGTGRDIPNLLNCIQTVAIGSKQLVIQVAGRTRPVKLYPELDPSWYYLTCNTISPHMRYHKHHMLTFRERSKSLTEINSGIYLN